MSPVNEEVAKKYATEQLGLLTAVEMKRRRDLCPEYFVPGKIYRVRKNFLAFRKDKNQYGRRKRVELERDTYLLCVTCSKVDVENAIIEFIYHETMLHYKTDGKALSCMLDAVEFETNE